MTELTPEERDVYAPPGSLTRGLIEDGWVDWPTREEAAVELGMSDFLSTGRGTFAVGDFIVEVDATGDEAQ